MEITSGYSVLKGLLKNLAGSQPCNKRPILWLGPLVIGLDPGGFPSVRILVTEWTFMYSKWVFIKTIHHMCGNCFDSRIFILCCIMFIFSI